MDGTTKKSHWTRKSLILGALLGVFAFTGCQVSMNGMTLPSPWYLNDDVHYAPAGSEFPLPREAAQMESLKKEQ